MDKNFHLCALKNEFRNFRFRLFRVGGGGEIICVPQASDQVNRALVVARAPGN